MLQARILLLALVAALAAPASGPAQTPRISAKEREALIAFYQSTQGEDWTDNTGWLGPPGTECKWVGLSCTCFTSAPTGCLQVYAIELPSNSLRGPLPRKLADLKQLRTLDLRGNRLRGPVPRELGTLRHMSFIDLAGNELQGQIPAELGKLSQLEWLDLGGNRLGPVIPDELAGLKRLQVLSLSANNLRGKIPRWLGTLPRLVSLGLNRNQLTGEIPPEIFELTELENLSLDENLLSGRIPPGIGDHDLHAIGLHGNRLTGPIPETITNLPFLDSINVEWNAVYTSSAEIEKFIADRGGHISWLATQTLAPIDVAATSVSPTAVRLTWTPVNSFPGTLNEQGGYQVYARVVSGERFHLVKTIVGKQVRSVEVGWLEPGTAYVFAVRAFSSPHEENRNRVLSELSERVAVTTPGT